MSRSKITSSSVDNTVAKKNASGSEPSAPVAGDTWWDTAQDKFKIHDGTAWHTIKSLFAATGGTEVESGGYMYHTFTSSGTFRVTSGSADVEY